MAATTVFLILCLSLPVFAQGPQVPSGTVFDVREFGALGDGRTLDTRALQAAIDSCAVMGGTVLLPAGKYLSGTLHLRSNVTLEIVAGGTLLGSTDIRDYPSVASPIPTTADIYHTQSLIVGIDLENVSLTGRGTIDGQGWAFVPKSRKKPDRYKDRPNGIRLIRCRNVRIQDLTLRNSGKWMQHYFACEKVSIRGITVDNNCNMNNDMMDIDGCRDVTISDCIGESDDDALTLKSTSMYPCENVTITNCVIGSHCNALKLGTESCGGFRNIVISNIVIRPTRHDSVIFGRRNGQGGITLTVVDGGRLDGVVISNVRMEGPATPIFVRLGDRGRTPMPGGTRPEPGILRNVTITDVLATGADTTGCSITGLPDHPVENVMLSNVRLAFMGGAGGGERVYAELPDAYPEGNMFGTLPGYGINLRHVRGIRLRNVGLTVERPETRCAVDAHDVSGLVCEGLEADPPIFPEALIRLRDCADVLMRGSVLHSEASLLVSVCGTGSRDIRITGNDMAYIKQVVRVAPEVGEGAIRIGNQHEQE